jgi:hypothetical protein
MGLAGLRACGLVHTGRWGAEGSGPGGATPQNGRRHDGISCGP